MSSVDMDMLVRIGRTTERSVRVLSILLMLACVTLLVVRCSGQKLWHTVASAPAPFDVSVAVLRPDRADIWAFAACPSSPLAPPSSQICFHVVWIFDTVLKLWRQQALAGTVPPPRAAPSIAWLCDGILLGGSDPSPAMLSFSATSVFFLSRDGIWRVLRTQGDGRNVLLNARVLVAINDTVAVAAATSGELARVRCAAHTSAGPFASTAAAAARRCAAFATLTRPAVDDWVVERMSAALRPAAEGAMAGALLDVEPPPRVLFVLQDDTHVTQTRCLHVDSDRLQNAVRPHSVQPPAIGCRLAGVLGGKALAVGCGSAHSAAVLDTVRGGWYLFGLEPPLPLPAAGSSAPRATLLSRRAGRVWLLSAAGVATIDLDRLYEIGTAHFRRLGDAALREHRLSEAIDAYNEALALSTHQHVELYLQAQAWRDAGQYVQALETLDRCVALRPDFAPARVQRARLCAGTGNFACAVQDFAQLGEEHASEREAVLWAQAAAERGVRALLHDRTADAVAALNEAVSVAPAGALLRLYRGEAHLRRENFHPALADLAAAIRLDRNLARAWFLRGEAFYALEEFPMAARHYRECVRLDPELRECGHKAKLAERLGALVAEAMALMGNRSYEPALEKLQEALAVDTSHRAHVGTMNAYICACFVFMESFAEALPFCSRAIALQPLLYGALVHRAQAYLGLGRMEEAVRDLLAARNLAANDPLVNELLARALRLQKQAKRQDHYAVLEVERDADEATIRRAYRRLALQWHPDKNNGSAAALERFRAIAEAYRVLSDPELRRRYDAGELDSADEASANEWGWSGDPDRTASPPPPPEPPFEFHVFLPTSATGNGTETASGSPGP